VLLLGWGSEIGRAEMRPSVFAAAAVLAMTALLGPSAGQDLQINGKDSNTAVMVLGSQQAEGVLGKEIRSKADENMGRLVDVVVDRSGRPRAAVIDFGGFLGVGSRKIAIDWAVLSFEADERQRDVVIVDLTREQVKAAPEYKGKRPVVVLSSAAAPLPAN
jgi:PRC-barrel domain protein